MFKKKTWDTRTKANVLKVFLKAGNVEVHAPNHETCFPSPHQEPRVPPAGRQRRVLRPQPVQLVEVLLHLLGLAAAALDEVHLGGGGGGRLNLVLGRKIILYVALNLL